MKYLFTLLALTISTNLSLAQKLDSVETFDMKMSFDETKEKFKPNFSVSKELILKDGSKIVIGQDVKLGESVNKISNDFETIFVGKLTIGGALLSPPVRANKTTLTSFNYIVEEIKIMRSMGLVSAVLYLKNTSTETMGLRYVSATHMSFENGEAINPNRPLNRAEAIAKLKEAKDLLDLNLMSQEEYEAMKNELTPIIRGEN
jgi:hypothetical protein